MNSKRHTFLIAVGDIFLKTSGGNKNPFIHINNILSKGNFIFGNLEVVLSKTGKPIPKRVPLRVNPEKAIYLKESGFHVVNIANNHVMDYGEEAFEDMLKTLKGNGISFIGAGINCKEARKAEIVDVGGVKIGFLGYTEVGVMANDNNPGCARLDIENIKEDIDLLRLDVDIIIISSHWGIEYVRYPMPKQQKIARELIDCGAKVILGHHPHVVQGVEKYRGGLIFYSLGNFNFGVEQDKKYSGADMGLAVAIKLSTTRVDDFELIPIKISESLHPFQMKGIEREEFIDYIHSISRKLENNGLTDNFWFEEASDIYLSSQIESYLIRIRRYGIRHFLMFLRWLISPFVIKMWKGKFRKILKVRKA